MMLFEYIGRFFFEKKRIWLFFLFLTAPFFCVFIFLIPRFVILRNTEKLFDAAALRGRHALEKRLEKEQFLNRYSHFDPYFIDQYLEALPLLQSNLRGLYSLKDHPACKNQEALTKRIEYLESVDNRLSFAEENMRSSKRVKETEEKLLHPVEIDGKDLNRLLAIIEDVAIDGQTSLETSPQLIIQEFSLTRKQPAVYELNLALLKREFIRASEK